MNINDNANAFRVKDLPKVIYISLSTYRGKDGEKSLYTTYTGIIFKKNATDRLLKQVASLSKALENEENIPVKVNGYLHDLSATNADDGNTYPQLDIVVTELSGVSFAKVDYENNPS